MNAFFFHSRETDTLSLLAFDVSARLDFMGGGDGLAHFAVLAIVCGSHGSYETGHARGSQRAKAALRCLMSVCPSGS